MLIPLTLCIAAFIAAIAALIWLLVQAQRRVDQYLAHMLQVSKDYADHALGTAADAVRDHPNNVQKMMDSLSAGIRQANESNAAAMVTLYGPSTVQAAQMEGSQGDILTPWYAEEGALDMSDPTDRLLVADPVEYPEGGNNLIVDGDEEPFGIPGLKLGM
jgi:hypothetical protein